MQRLPNADSAAIDPRKLAYALDPTHPSGRHKARVFRSALGFGPGDEPRLERLLRSVIRTEPANHRGTTPLGEELWVVQSLLECRQGHMRFITAWAISPGADAPRLVSCYLKGVKR